MLFKERFTLNCQSITEKCCLWALVSLQGFIIKAQAFQRKEATADARYYKLELS